jgi:hypothetical protein
MNHHAGITNMKNMPYAQKQLHSTRQNSANRLSTVQCTSKAIADGRLRFAGKSASFKGRSLDLFRAALAQLILHLSRDEAPHDSPSRVTIISSDD